MSDQSKG